MASAEKLVRDAQYAFHNISTGSTDEKKFAASARKIAQRIVRRYPMSVEAIQARDILDRLGVRSETIAPTQPQRVVEFLKNHTGHVDHFGAGNDATAADSDDWKSLLWEFLHLPGSRKKILFFAAAFLFFFPGTIFVLAGLAIVYALKPDLLRSHLRRLLTALGSAQKS